MRKHFKHMGLSYIQKLLVFLSQRAAMKNRNTLRNCKAPGTASKWGQREKTSPSSGVCLRLFSYQSPNGVSWNSSAVLEQGSPLFLWDPQASSGVSVGSGLVTLHSIDLVTHRTTLAQGILSYHNVEALHGYSVLNMCAIVTRDWKPWLYIGQSPSSCI